MSGSVPAICFSRSVIGHVVLISAQVNAKTGVPMLEAVTFGAFAEVQRATSAVLNGVRDVWTGYVGLRGVRAENEALRRELASAQVEIQRAAGAGRPHAQPREHPRAARTASTLQTTAAQIIGAAASPDFRTVTIDKGTAQGLRADMAVHRASRRRRPGRRRRRRAPSRVQLLIDRNAAAGALIERSRAQGVVVGAGDDRLRLEYVSEVADVAVGDTVVTSGIDGIYPEGLRDRPGRQSVDKSGVAYRQIGIRPAVDFSSARRRAGRADADPGAAAAGGEAGVKAPGCCSRRRSLSPCRRRWIAGSVDRRRGPGAGRCGLHRARVRAGRRDCLTGTFAGLVQDALSSGVIGIGGLAKTIVGFLAGIVGTQFIVAQSASRFVVFFLATDRERRDVHGAVRAAGLASLRDTGTRRLPGRGSAMPSSVCWRSSSSSSCRERSNGAGWANAGFADEVGMCPRRIRNRLRRS